jgi:hypothetical protein
VICSTPCLFAAQHGIERYLDLMLETNRLPSEGTTSMNDCARVLSSSQNQKSHWELRTTRTTADGRKGVA